MLTGLVDTDNPAQYQEAYFAPCYHVRHILSRVEGVKLLVPEIDSLPRHLPEKIAPPIPVKQPGRPPKTKQAPGPKAKEKRILSRGEVTYANKRRKTKAGQSTSNAAATGAE